MFINYFIYLTAFIATMLFIIIIYYQCNYIQQQLQIGVDKTFSIAHSAAPPSVEVATRWSTESARTWTDIQTVVPCRLDV